MGEATKTRMQLLEEIRMLQQRNLELEALEKECRPAREALGRAEKLLSSIFRASSDLFTVYGKDLAIRHCNWDGDGESIPEAIRRLHGNCGKMFPSGCGTKCEACHILEVFKTGKTVLFQKTVDHVGDLELMAYPVTDESGSVVMVTEQIRNIADRERTETECRLRRRKREPSTGQKEDPLWETFAINGDSADIFDQQSCRVIMGKMLGNMAHQWRKPLTVISLLVQDISECYNYGEFDKEYLDATIGRIMRVIQQMSQTLDDFANILKSGKPGE